MNILKIDKTLVKKIKNFCSTEVWAPLVFAAWLFIWVPIAALIGLIFGLKLAMLATLFWCGLMLAGAWACGLYLIFSVIAEIWRESNK